MNNSEAKIRSRMLNSNEFPLQPGDYGQKSTSIIDETYSWPKTRGCHKNFRRRQSFRQRSTS